MNLKGASRMKYRSIKNPATVGSVTPADVEKATRALGPFPRKASTHQWLKGTPEGGKTSYVSPGLIRTLRKRLDITQKELAALSAVTVGAIYRWESGKSKPKDPKKRVIVGLRKLRRGDVRELLERKK
jgi:DNA-binding transcriptional regulator YiaG